MNELIKTLQSLFDIRYKSIRKLLILDVVELIHSFMHVLWPEENVLLIMSRDIMWMVVFNWNQTNKFVWMVTNAMRCDAVSFK